MSNNSTESASFTFWILQYGVSVGAYMIAYWIALALTNSMTVALLLFILLPFYLLIVLSSISSKKSIEELKSEIEDTHKQIEQ